MDQSRAFDSDLYDDEAFLGNEEGEVLEGDVLEDLDVGGAPTHGLHNLAVHASQMQPPNTSLNILRCLTTATAFTYLCCNSIDIFTWFTGGGVL